MMMLSLRQIPLDAAFFQRGRDYSGGGVADKGWYGRKFGQVPDKPGTFARRWNVERGT